MGVRLRLADLAAGFSLSRAPRSPAHRRASRALRLFLGASRHARPAGPRARPRPRRHLPRRWRFAWRPRSGRTSSPICASASRSPPSISSGCGRFVSPTALRRVRSPIWSTAATPNMRASSTRRCSCASFQVRKAARARIRDYVIATAAHLAELGMPDRLLERLSERLRELAGRVSDWRVRVSAHQGGETPPLQRLYAASRRCPPTDGRRSSMTARRSSGVEPGGARRARRGGARSSPPSRRAATPRPSRRRCRRSRQSRRLRGNPRSRRNRCR